MTGAIHSFEEKVREVDLYFKFLNNALENDIQLFFPTKKTWRFRIIEEDLQKMFKANSFLILYNLVESAMRNGIDEIYDSIKKQQMSYGVLSEKIKKTWLRDKFFELERGYAKPDRYRDLAFDLIKDVLDKVVIELDIQKIPIAGNIDAAQVRNISERIGFSAKVHKQTKGGEKLEIVKSMRNSLAHGAVSFSECGRDFTFDELKIIKTEVVAYLRNILRNMEKFSAKNEFQV